MDLQTLPLPLVSLAALALLLVIIVIVLAVRRRNTPAARMERALRQISHARLQDIYLPDGVGGHIHVDELLLTSKGLLVLDVKDVPGHVFGSEKMAEWVVMTGRSRHTFRNPLPGLHDRMAVVRTHLRDIHVEGYVVFTERGRFPKGKPPGTLTVAELLERFGSAGNDFPQAFANAWKELERLADIGREETQRPLA
ncbi:MAG TPA: nuclease-related domain-containing protein [Gammaproteobacteria bacterium]|nr:nuclease-related domain-containing protein [Gammaproteobacteria bacterium]